MKIFKKKGLYIILTILFSLLFAASLAGCFLIPDVPDMSGFGDMQGMGGFPGGNMPDMSEFPTDGEMPDMSSFPGGGNMPSGSSSSEGDMPDMSEFPTDGEMPDMGSFPGGGERPDMPGSTASGISKLKKFCLPTAIASGILDALSIFMLIRITKKQKAETVEAEQPEEIKETEEKPAKKKKRAWIPVLAIVLAIALVMTLLPTSKRPEGGVEVEQQLLSAQAEIGSLTQNLYFGGSLADCGETELSLVSGVTVDEWLVSEGDYVEAGQQLAAVNKSSVLSVISEVNELLNELDCDIESSRSDTVSSTVTAPISGRVKAVYASAGESVLDSMYENGALALLSLDGLMSIKIDAGELSVGTVVTVKTDDSEYQGTVLDVADETATVTVSDEKTELGESVTVLDGNGKTLGSGELEIHSSAKVTAIGGTVSYVYIDINDTLTAGATMFALTDTSYEGNYQYLLQCRTVLSQQLSSLFTVYESGGLYAVCAGRVSSVNDGVTEIADTDSMMPQGMMGGMSFGSSSSAAENNAQPGGEGQGEPKGENEPEGEPTVLTEKIGRVQQIGETSVTVSLTGETCEINLADLVAALGSTSVDNVRQGDILVLMYDGEGALVKATLYQQYGGGSSQQQESSVPGGAGGGTGFSTTAETEEEEADYTLDETQLYSIVPYDSGEIEITADELDVAKLYIGEAVKVVFDALQGEYEGQITDIDPDGTNDGGNTKYSVTVMLQRSEEMLTGMNASVTAEVDSYESLLLIPAAALQEDEDGSFVYTSYDEKEDELGGKVYVETGLSDEENVEILSGIASGDSVYYRYADTLVYKIK